MERALDRLHQAGIKVILGTPTYSIPTWLYKKHPEIVVTHNGAAPPLGNPYVPTYPSSGTPGYYGPRQNYDFLNLISGSMQNGSSGRSSAGSRITPR
jgi:beta-galactosidase